MLLDCGQSAGVSTFFRKVLVALLFVHLKTVGRVAFRVLCWVVLCKPQTSGSIPNVNKRLVYACRLRLAGKGCSFLSVYFFSLPMFN